MGIEVGIGALLTSIGTATAVAGTGYSVYSGAKAAGASRDAERLRQRQLNLDSAMKRREMLRKIQLSRSTALSRTTVAGAQKSSALGGALGSIQQRGGEDLNYNQQSTDIGNDLFAANRDITTFQSQAQAGQGIGNLGFNLIQSAPTLSRIGTDLFGGESTSGKSGGGYRGPYISTIY